jgi:hypothetical protein
VEKVSKPLFVLQYENVDITNDISPYYDRIEYTDYLSGMCDELVITLTNRDGRWFRSWMPQKADRIRLFLGYENKKLLRCGIFIIDEISYSGFPDKVDIKCSSFPYEPADLHKTKKKRTFENTTLKNILLQIVQENGMQPFVNIDPDIEIKRIDQFEETDSTFLAKLAEEYGYAVKFAEEKIIFVKHKNLEDEDAAATFNKNELISYQIKDTIHTLYKEATVEYFDAKQQEIKKYTFYDPDIKWGETLMIEGKLDSMKQAEEKAKAALRMRNMFSSQLNIEIPGNTKTVAGLTINLQGFGNYNGKYIVNSSKHSLDDSGYTTNLELRKCWNY